jgi:hypothetical protein
VADVKVPAQGFLNYREAAAMLGVKTPVIRGLVTQGCLGAPVGYQLGLSKLIPAADVQSFAEQYVAATILAKRRKVSGRSFSCYLKESGAPLLIVPIPEEGRSQALFVPKSLKQSLFPERQNGSRSLRAAYCLPKGLSRSIKPAIRLVNGMGISS